MEEHGLSDEEYGWSDEEEYGSKDKSGITYVIHDDGSAMISESEPESESESESEWNTSCKFGNVEIGGVGMIYPGLDLDHYSYRHADVRDFSRRAIANYNRDTGHSYEFVELVEAFVTLGADLVTAIFKAIQRDNDLSIATFEAQTYTPDRTLIDSNLDIKVVPLHSGSDSGFQPPHPHASVVPEKLDTRVEQLQIST